MSGYRFSSPGIVFLLGFFIGSRFIRPSLFLLGFLMFLNRVLVGGFSGRIIPAFVELMQPPAVSVENQGKRCYHSPVSQLTQGSFSRLGEQNFEKRSKRKSFVVVFISLLLVAQYENES